MTDILFKALLKEEQLLQHWTVHEWDAGHV